MAERSSVILFGVQRLVLAILLHLLVCASGLKSSLKSGRLLHFPGLRASLSEYLEECSALGPVRFVVVGEGAILETVGSFSNLRFSEGVKGRLATLSTDEPCFECHIRLAECKSALHAVVEKQGRTLRIVRFLAADGKTAHLSAILHGDDDKGKKKFEALKLKYGEKISFDL
jgi:hypothetical protein